jgi:hypothetical protein
MRSPFPGVDPYLESQGFWPDFHASFITYWRDALAERLPDNYEARMDERVSLVDLPAERIKRMEPDLAITQRGPSVGSAQAPAGVATLEPITVPLLVEEEYRETYIEIRQRPNRTLVAVLELLSPANKEEPGRRSYLDKRNALLRERVHLVELDLLLGGRRLPLSGAYPQGHFYALISHADRRPDCDVYAWTVRQPLPALPIPLRPPDPEVWLNLAEVFALTYERGRYARSVDYASPVAFALSDEDRSWAAQAVRANQS